MYQNVYYQRQKNLIHLWDDKLGYRTFPYTRYAYEKAQNGEFVSLYGDRLKRITQWEKDQQDLFEDECEGYCGI